MIYNLLLLILLICSTPTVAQTNWPLVEQSYIRGTIKGTVSHGYVFSVSRRYYIITHRTRQRVNVRNPNVNIYKAGSFYLLEIEGFDEPVTCDLLKEVYESSITGEFAGWEQNAQFELLNGQVWSQISYTYSYHYAYNPKTLIFYHNGSWNMQVEGMAESVAVARLR